MDLHALAPHPTSSLNEARNDTGRTAFCGPYVLSALTGYSISKVEDVIRSGRHSERKTVVSVLDFDPVPQSPDCSLCRDG